jgi:hypothetical protein
MLFVSFLKALLAKGGLLWIVSQAFYFFLAGTSRRARVDKIVARASAATSTVSSGSCTLYKQYQLVPIYSYPTVHDLAVHRPPSPVPVSTQGDVDPEASAPATVTPAPSNASVVIPETVLPAELLVFGTPAVMSKS